MKTGEWGASDVRLHVCKWYALVLELRMKLDLGDTKAESYMIFVTMTKHDTKME